MYLFYGIYSWRLCIICDPHFLCVHRFFPFLFIQLIGSRLTQATFNKQKLHADKHSQQKILKTKPNINYNTIHLFKLTVCLCFWWVLICLLRWSDLMNFLLHSGHWNRFSPVCVLRCLWSSSDLVKRLPQNSHVHTKGRSPVCQRKCARKWEVLP